jgi:hypothetical protein
MPHISLISLNSKEGPLSFLLLLNDLFVFSLKVSLIDVKMRQ